MKVLHVINSLEIGGAEKLVVDSAPLFGKSQIRTDVLCLKNKKTIFSELLEKDTTVQWTGLSGGSVYNPLLIFKLMPFLKKYDIVHGHLFPTLYWMVLAKWLSFSPVQLIYTEHSTSNRRRKSFLFKTLDRIIYRGLSKIITISEEVDHNIKAHLQFPQKRFRRIYNGVDIIKFRDARPYPKETFFNRDSFLIIQSSSFRAQKDQATLIRAMQFLPQNVKLLLAGDGALRATNEELVVQLGLEGRVRFLGNRPDIARLLKTADVAVLSTHYEGMPLAAIEGMLSGPFIGSNVPGLREIVGKYGLLFEEGNEKELADRILMLYNDSAYYEKVARQCLEWAQNFSITRMVEDYIDVYKKTG